MKDWDMQVSYDTTTRSNPLPQQYLSTCHPCCNGGGWG